jgi:hypothetical protein
MDVCTGSATLANTSTSTFAAPARKSARAQPSAVAPEVKTSSTRTSLRPAIAALPSAGTRNAPWIGGPLRPRQPDLLDSGLHALQRRRGYRYPGLRGNCRRQHSRLVEAPRPISPPMQRHRDERVSLGNKLASGKREPAPHHRRKIEPVAIFERMHQRPGNFVETHRGAGALIGRRVGYCLHRQNAGTGIVDEGDAEPLTIGSGDERKLRPTAGTESDAVDRGAADGAERRERNIERRAQECARRIRRPFNSRRTGEPCRGRHGGNGTLHAADCHRLWFARGCKCEKIVR